MEPAQDQPWQERLLFFCLLCAMVFWLARILINFRSAGLRLRRQDTASSSEDEEPEDEEPSHSD